MVHYLPESFILHSSFPVSLIIFANPSALAHLAHYVAFIVRFSLNLYHLDIVINDLVSVIAFFGIEAGPRSHPINPFGPSSCLTLSS